MSSYRHRKSHCGDKTILRPSYHHNGISYTGKITSLYWIRALISQGSFSSCRQLQSLSQICVLLEYDKSSCGWVQLWHWRMALAWHHVPGSRSHQRPPPAPPTRILTRLMTIINNPWDEEAAACCPEISAAKDTGNALCCMAGNLNW